MLIHPRHRIASLVMLRMTFPVDVLSYALGLFSPGTSMGDVALSTAIGAAPFALLFALFPSLSTTTQLVVFGASTAVFAIYAVWLLRGPSRH
jgi:membrane associated rhomboid family serine protease